MSKTLEILPNNVQWNYWSVVSNELIVTNILLPSQFVPFGEKPLLHSQAKLPNEFEHVEFT